MGPVDPSTGQPIAEARPSSPLPAGTWLVLVALGVLLFAGGVYLGLAVSGVVHSALPKNPFVGYVPYVLTIVGGALAMYSYEGWYQHPDGPGGKQRRESALKDIPSYEVYGPRGPKGPP